jgi:hypothetical protein
MDMRLSGSLIIYHSRVSDNVEGRKKWQPANINGILHFAFAGTFLPLWLIMGKRKKSSRKPMGPKKVCRRCSGWYSCYTNHPVVAMQSDPLPSTFTCLFCNHEKSVTVKLDRKAGVGQLDCRICGQKFQCAVNCKCGNLRPKRVVPFVLMQFFIWVYRSFRCCRRLWRMGWCRRCVANANRTIIHIPNY